MRFQHYGFSERYYCFSPEIHLYYTRTILRTLGCLCARMTENSGFELKLILNSGEINTFCDTHYLWERLYFKAIDFFKLRDFVVVRICSHP